MGLLRVELQTIRKLWNTHYIRKTRNENVPYGRPDVIYYLPEMFGGQECLLPVNENEVRFLADLLTIDVPTCNEDYAEIFEMIMADGNKHMPRTLDEADELLVYILDKSDFYLTQI